MTAGARQALPTQREGPTVAPASDRLGIRAERFHVLPLSLPPRGLNRCEAAAYIGVSPSLFDAMVKDGRMPRPKRINSRLVWDRRQLDLAFDALPEQHSLSSEIDEADQWLSVAV